MFITVETPGVGDKCNICNKVCKYDKYFDGWNSICSRKCLELWDEENNGF